MCITYLGLISLIFWLEWKEKYDFMVQIMENILLLILLHDRCPCPAGVHIVGWWCPTLCIEAKDTLYSVSI